MPEFKNRDARKQHHLQSHLLNRNEPTKAKGNTTENLSAAQSAEEGSNNTVKEHLRSKAADEKNFNS